MKRQIRRGVFETNSSSTHCICITKNDKYKKLDHVEFGFDSFGWEFDEYNDTATKANYLYTAITCLFDGQELEDHLSVIRGYLESEGISCEFLNEIDYDLCCGYGIDHYGELLEFVEDICGDKDKLFRFLFSDKSFILTGNDNCYEGEEIIAPVGYKGDTYFKGN